MTHFTAADARRFALAATGALIFSATCIAGAIAPAAAQTMTPNAPLTVADWQADVGAQLNAKLTVPAAALAHRDHLVAVVAVSFDKDGRFAGARVIRSSGHAGADAGVVRVAGRIAYPPLPAGYRGRPNTIVMQAYFGEAATPLDMARHEDAAKALASRPAPSHDAVRTAAIPNG
ncbi:MAG: TonB family protein [Sphingomonas sp.]